MTASHQASQSITALHVGHVLMTGVACYACLQERCELREIRLATPPGVLVPGAVAGLMEGLADTSCRAARRLAVLLGCHARLGQRSPIRSVAGRQVAFVCSWCGVVCVGSGVVGAAGAGSVAEKRRARERTCGPLCSDAFVWVPGATLMLLCGCMCGACRLLPADVLGRILDHALPRTSCQLKLKLLFWAPGALPALDSDDSDDSSGSSGGDDSSESGSSSSDGEDGGDVQGAAAGAGGMAADLLAVAKWLA